MRCNYCGALIRDEKTITCPACYRHWKGAPPENVTLSQEPQSARADVTLLPEEDQVVKDIKFAIKEIKEIEQQYNLWKKLEMRCQVCGKPMPYKRRHSKTCSSRCRKALSRRMKHEYADE